MTSYESVKKSESKFIGLTGYTVEEFEALLPNFTVQFMAYVAKYTLEGKPRKKRSYSEYTNSPLPGMANKLLFILIYLKTNNLQEVQAELFGMYQSEACQWIHCLLPVVNQALNDCGQLPARSMDGLALDEQTGTIFFHDGTERPIQRPKDNETQRSHYSGKKKRHTVKNDVIGGQDSRILFLTETVEGKKHDKKLADEADYTLPDGSTLYQDTGFQGFDLENVTILQPKKKPRNAELSEWDKVLNRALSSVRIRIEHIISGVKRYRIVKDKIRNFKAGFRDLVMETCCGLHNFRLTFRPWHYSQPPLFQFMIKSL